MEQEKVWVNGTFDVFHVGHLALLEYASRHGELHVGIDTDERVQELKGEDRPIFNLAQRIRMLSALRCVHRVYAFHDEESLCDIIERLSPEVFVIGSDYKDKRIVGKEFAKKVVFFDRIEGISSTQILDAL